MKSTKSLVAVFFLLLCFTVFFAIAGSGKGAKIVSIERKIRAIEDQNRELEAKLVSNNSLTKVSQKASEKGLTKDVTIVYWNQDQSVAKLP